MNDKINNERILPYNNDLPQLINTEIDVKIRMDRDRCRHLSAHSYSYYLGVFYMLTYSSLALDFALAVRPYPLHMVMPSIQARPLRPFSSQDLLRHNLVFEKEVGWLSHQIYPQAAHIYLWRF